MSELLKIETWRSASEWLKSLGPRIFQGSQDFGGRKIEQLYPQFGTFLELDNFSRISDLDILCNSADPVPASAKPAALRSNGRCHLSRVTCSGLFAWGLEFLGAHRDSRIRDCEFHYVDVGQPKGVGHCAIFSGGGGRNVEGLIVDGCYFDLAGVADNAVWISKGGDTTVRDCRVEGYNLEAMVMGAGPATVEGCSFRTSVTTKSAVAAIFWADTDKRERGIEHYILRPFYRFARNEVIGGAGGVNAGRPSDAQLPVPMEVEIEQNHFEVSADAIVVAGCTRSLILRNTGTAETFVRVAAMDTSRLCADVDVIGNHVTTRAPWLIVSQEARGLIRILGNTIDAPQGVPHLRLVHPAGSYRVLIDGNEFRTEGRRVEPRIQVPKYPQSVGSIEVVDGQGRSVPTFG